LTLHKEYLKVAPKHKQYETQAKIQKLEKLVAQSGISWIDIPEELQSVVEDFKLFARQIGTLDGFGFFGSIADWGKKAWHGLKKLGSKIKNKFQGLYCDYLSTKIGQTAVAASLTATGAGASTTAAVVYAMQKGKKYACSASAARHKKKKKKKKKAKPVSEWFVGTKSHSHGHRRHRRHVDRSVVAADNLVKSTKANLEGIGSKYKTTQEPEHSDLGKWLLIGGIGFALAVGTTVVLGNKK